MLNHKELDEIYQELFSAYKSNRIKKFFKINGNYYWGGYKITIEKSGNKYFAKIDKINIYSMGSTINEALLNMVDQAICYYEEYCDEYDDDSDNILEIFENLLYKLYPSVTFKRSFLEHERKRYHSEYVASPILHGNFRYA